MTITRFLRILRLRAITYTRELRAKAVNCIKYIHRFKIHLRETANELQLRYNAAMQEEIFFLLLTDLEKEIFWRGEEIIAATAEIMRKKTTLHMED